MNNFEIRKAIYSDCHDLSILKREIWETTYRGIYPNGKLDNYEIHCNYKNGKERYYGDLIINEEYIILDFNKFEEKFQRIK